jgi:hypothetical protein
MEIRMRGYPAISFRISQKGFVLFFTYFDTDFPLDFTLVFATGVSNKRAGAASAQILTCIPQRRRRV